MKSKFPRLARQTRHLFGFSPWLVVGVSIILGLAIIYLAVRGNEREKEKMSDNLVDRANALIWALEAGTRTWLGFQGERNVLQMLIEETAKQPGIKYLAVADFNGRILAHSDEGKVGTRIDPKSIPSRAEMESADWRLVNSPKAPVFEVYRLFAPIREGHGMGGGRGGHHGMNARRRQGGDALAVGQENFVLVGLDQQPFQEALEADFHNTMLSAFIVAALGLGGFISMFWAHSYQHSHRLLLDTQALASEVITNLPLGLITSDAEGRIETVNAPARSMLGRSDGLAGVALGDLPALDWNAVVGELARGGKVLERETELAVSDDKTIPVVLSASQIRNAEGALLGHVFIFGDIEEVKRLQSEVRRNERLTALGNLAAGVAHEIRNPLSTIKGLATYIARKLPPGGREEEAAKTMIVEVNRLNTVVSELLEFARPNPATGASADANEVVERALRLADADIRAGNVAVVFAAEADAPRVRVNGERLAQALLNLFLNAVQAMPSGGTLRVTTRSNPAGGDFRIVVQDDGVGMSAEVRESIFNPYFTTKGSGTGLGLAIVHQIVEGHGGTVTVKSSPGAGAVFTLHLPVDREAGANAELIINN